MDGRGWRGEWGLVGVCVVRGSGVVGCVLGGVECVGKGGGCDCLCIKRYMTI